LCPLLFLLNSLMDEKRSLSPFLNSLKFALQEASRRLAKDANKMAISCVCLMRVFSRYCLNASSLINVSSLHSAQDPPYIGAGFAAEAERVASWVASLNRIG
jgi:hypothetical protein